MPMRDRLLTILRPIYQDLDDIERVGRIARSLTTLTPELELLLLFYPVATWMEKPRNFSRVAVAGGISEKELHATMASVRRLSQPRTMEERAVAAAILIDASGVRGLAERFAHARREGLSVTDVAREAIEENTVPEWMTDEAATMLETRLRERRLFCEALLREL